jgi:hypothetical protein
VASKRHGWTCGGNTSVAAGRLPLRRVQYDDEASAASDLVRLMSDGGPQVWRSLRRELESKSYEGFAAIGRALERLEHTVIPQEVAASALT